MVIIVENGHGDKSSKSWTRLFEFHIALLALCEMQTAKEKYESNKSPSSYGLIVRQACFLTLV